MRNEEKRFQHKTLWDTAYVKARVGMSKFNLGLSVRARARACACVCMCVYGARRTVQNVQTVFADASTRQSRKAFDYRPLPLTSCSHHEETKQHESACASLQ